MSIDLRWLPLERDGHRWEVLCIAPASPQRVLVWLPALGVPARHYEAFGHALAERGVAVLVHEWRGFGSSSQRASRTRDWGYRELLTIDIAATREAASTLFPDLPRAIGGHSLGGQLACCSVALDRHGVAALWLVASGAPYWKAFPWPYRAWLPVAYRLLDLLARACGALPGRRIGFGGQEARGVIRDWSRTALTGRYGARGIGDLEASLDTVRTPVRAVLLARDWLAPRGSLEFLLAKLDPDRCNVSVLDAHALGARADHFGWLRAPAAVAHALAG